MNLRVQRVLFAAAAGCFYSPGMLPETITVGNKTFNVSYVRADDDSAVRIAAWDPETAQDVAALELRVELDPNDRDE